MPTSDDQRYARMYDEHQAPRKGIEEEIMAELGTGSPRQPKELITVLVTKGFHESDVRRNVWSLIDRGFIELTVDRKLLGRRNPVNPAPVDLL